MFFILVHLGRCKGMCDTSLDTHSLVHHSHNFSILKGFQLQPSFWFYFWFYYLISTLKEGTLSTFFAVAAEWGRRRQKV